LPLVSLKSLVIARLSLHFLPY